MNDIRIHDAFTIKESKPLPILNADLTLILQQAMPYYETLAKYKLSM